MPTNPLIPFTDRVGPSGGNSTVSTDTGVVSTPDPMAGPMSQFAWDTMYPQQQADWLANLLTGGGSDDDRDGGGFREDSDLDDSQVIGGAPLPIAPRAQFPNSEWRKDVSYEGSRDIPDEGFQDEKSVPGKRGKTTVNGEVFTRHPGDGELTESEMQAVEAVEEELDSDKGLLQRAVDTFRNNKGIVDFWRKNAAKGDPNIPDPEGEPWVLTDTTAPYTEGTPESVTPEQRPARPKLPSEPDWMAEYGILDAPTGAGSRGLIPDIANDRGQFDYVSDDPEVVRAMMRAAEESLGSRYVWGGERPGSFDCSGLIRYVYDKAGVGDLLRGRIVGDEMSSGKRVPLKELRPGDLVAWDTGYLGATGARGDHIALYVGNGLVVAADNTRTGVRLRPLSQDFNPNQMWGVRVPLARKGTTTSTSSSSSRSSSSSSSRSSVSLSRTPSPFARAGTTGGQGSSAIADREIAERNSKSSGSSSSKPSSGSSRSSSGSSGSGSGSRYYGSDQKNTGNSSKKYSGIGATK